MLLLKRDNYTVKQFILLEIIRAIWFEWNELWFNLRDVEIPWTLILPWMPKKHGLMLANTRRKLRKERI